MKKIFIQRPQIDRSHPEMTRTKPPTCCFCCHVNVGTVVYSLLILVTSLFMVVAATLGLTGLIDQDNISSWQLRCAGYNSDLTNQQMLWVFLVNGLFFFSISALCVYGVVKSRAGFILPFFIVQLFNFLCILVYIGSVLFYWPNLKEHLKQCAFIPDEIKEKLINMDDMWLASIVFVVLLIVIFIKSYLISMVYKSYKFITLQVIMRRGATEINHVSGREAEKSVAIHIYNPPKYEDIQKIPLVDDVEDVDIRPPPYQEA